MAGRSKQVQCDICGKSTAARGLASHKRIVHNSLPSDGKGNPPAALVNMEQEVRRRVEVAMRARRQDDPGQGHTRLVDLLRQASGCPTCREDLEAHDRQVLERGFMNISRKALASLAIERGIIPTRIVLNIPDRA